MKMNSALLLGAMCLLASTLSAQQIGGGTCSPASLNGAYSMVLDGRNLASTETFTRVYQGVGIATFDGQNKVTFSLAANTNQALAISQTLSGFYTLQANCAGSVTISTGDTATFVLETYNRGSNFLITGQDGAYVFTGSGNVAPSNCATGIVSGTYSFNGSGFALTSGAVTGVNDVSGLMTFDGKGAATVKWYVAAAGPIAVDTLSGTYNVTSSCSGSAKLTNSADAAYTFIFTVLASDGGFAVSGANALLMFNGNGRHL